MRRTKLTLSVERDLVERGKKLAIQQGTSLSSMFSRFLFAVLSDRSRKFRIGPLTRKAAGLGKLPPGKTDRELLEEALGEKYGL